MNFGAEFHVDVFDCPKEKQKPDLSQRCVKQITPKWFMETNSMEVKDPDDSSAAQCLRHKADYLYYKKNYSEALVAYENFFKQVPSSNLPCNRECMENISRCLLHTGSADKALEWALKMHDVSFSPQHKVVSLNLLATVCHALDKYEEELEALHSCLEPQKNNPELWYRLAYCYSGMFKIHLPNSNHKLVPVPHCCTFKSRLVAQNGLETNVNCEPQLTENQSSESVQSTPDINNETSASEENLNQSTQESNSEELEKCEMCTLGVHLVSACLLRARILTSNSDKDRIPSEKYKNMNERITACLDCMEVDQSFIDEASNMLESELFLGYQSNSSSIT